MGGVENAMMMQGGGSGMTFVHLNNQTITSKEQAEQLVMQWRDLLATAAGGSVEVLELACDGAGPAAASTNGAGDALCGAAAAAVVQGASLRDAVETGARAAARVVAGLDNRARRN